MNAAFVQLSEEEVHELKNENIKLQKENLVLKNQFSVFRKQHDNIEKKLRKVKLDLQKIIAENRNWKNLVKKCVVQDANANFEDRIAKIDANKDFRERILSIQRIYVPPQLFLENSNIEEDIVQNNTDVQKETSHNDFSGGKSRSTAQARLNRKHRRQRGQNGSSESPAPISAKNSNFPTQQWKCPDPSCALTNNPKVMNCAKCGFKWVSDLDSRYGNVNKKLLEMMKYQGKLIKIKVQSEDNNSYHSDDDSALEEKQQQQKSPEVQPEQQQPEPLQHQQEQYQQSSIDDESSMITKNGEVIIVSAARLAFDFFNLEYELNLDHQKEMDLFKSEYQNKYEMLKLKTCDLLNETSKLTEELNDEKNENEILFCKQCNILAQIHEKLRSVNSSYAKLLHESKANVTELTQKCNDKSSEVEMLRRSLNALENEKKSICKNLELKLKTKHEAEFFNQTLQLSIKKQKIISDLNQEKCELQNKLRNCKCKVVENDSLNYYAAASLLPPVQFNGENFLLNNMPPPLPPPPLRKPLSLPLPNTVAPSSRDVFQVNVLPQRTHFFGHGI